MTGSPDKETDRSVIKKIRVKPFFTLAQKCNFQMDSNQILHIDSLGDVVIYLKGHWNWFWGLEGMGCKIWPIPLTSALASNTAYCTTMHMHNMLAHEPVLRLCTANVFVFEFRPKVVLHSCFEYLKLFLKDGKLWQIVISIVDYGITSSCLWLCILPVVEENVKITH